MYEGVRFGMAHVYIKALNSIFNQDEVNNKPLFAITLSFSP